MKELLKNLAINCTLSSFLAYACSKALKMEEAWPIMLASVLTSTGIVLTQYFFQQDAQKKQQKPQ